MESRSKSRRKTPWDTLSELTNTQEFLKVQYAKRYEQRHPQIADESEIKMINSYVPKCCPYCKSVQFSKKGLDSGGIQRYKCNCGKIFKPTTGTIFESRKIPVSEWIEYCLNIFRYVSLNADSWNNRNAISTSRYWLEKLFLTLENSQSEIILEDTIWLDETYYSLIMRDRVRDENGNYLRGLSRNQICIGVATDKKHTICFVEGFGKPSQKRSYETFQKHIRAGSTLIHDKESTHRKLVEDLNLNSICYSSKDLKVLADSENPLNPVNRVHCLLKMFLNAHSGFNREDLQNYLNLFIKMVFENPKSLKYRDQFA